VIPLAAATLALNFARHPKELCAVRVEIHNQHVYVPVEFGGKVHLSFLLDSGAAASLNILDRTLASKLGVVAEGSGSASAIGGNAKIAFAKSVDLCILQLRLMPKRVAIMDLAGGRAQEGHAVDGLLGFALFQAYVVQIDYPAAKLRLFAFDGQPMPRPDRETVRLPLEVSNKNCMITAKITLQKGAKAIPVRLILDTGLDTTVMLTSPFARKHGLLVGKATAGNGLGGAVSAREVSISDLAFDRNLHLRNIAVRASGDTEGAFSSPDVDGFIGGGVLENFVVTFDYKHRELLLTPRKK